MARGLYRAYLYVVTIALAVFLTFSVYSLLRVLLELTGLRGRYGSVTSGADVTQNVVLALVTLIIVAGLGGLHYWLIRRDMASDPRPGESGVRAFTLNLALLIATLTAVFSGAGALSQFDLTFQNELATALATAIAALGLALALEWERRRATPTRGAALVFQRLRIDGMGLILALITLSYLSSAVYRTENLIGNASGAIPCVATQPTGPFEGPYLPVCVGSDLIGVWAAAALVIVVWLVYLFRAGFQRTLIRPVFLLLGFAAGVIALIIGLQQIVEYLLRLITTSGAAPDYFNQYNAAPTLVFAALALAVYGWRLTRSEAHLPLDLPTTRLTLRAIGGAIFAGPFWVGAWMLLNDAFIRLFPGGQPTDTNWHQAIATAIAGLAYVPLALWLGASSRAEGIKGPRRGFVLVLLAAGALVTAGSAATLIYSVVTATLGVPLPNWQDVARQAGAALIVGLALGGLYLWLAAREGQFTRAPRPQVEPAGAAAEAGAVVAANGHAALDDVLAQFQQGGLSQAEAAERIRTLARTGALV
ncbi:MAG: DUF5671 domain-containing protein [Ktedonobacterales bacterium]